MNRILLTALSFCVLSACGMKEDKFKEQYIDASCQTLMECDEFTAALFGGDVETCKTLFSLAWSESTSGCEYDSSAAKECIDGIEGLECDGSAPGACEEVYTGGSCPWSSGTGGTGTSDTGW